MSRHALKSSTTREQRSARKRRNELVRKVAKRRARKVSSINEDARDLMIVQESKSINTPVCKKNKDKKVLVKDLSKLEKLLKGYRRTIPCKRAWEDIEERIEKIYFKTIQGLIDIGAKLEDTSESMRRYINNYLLSKSPLSFAFKGLGFTSPSQLGKSFYNWNKIGYFKTVYWLYYIHSTEDGYRYMDGLGGREHLFRTGMPLKMVSGTIGRYFFHLKKENWDVVKNAQNTNKKDPSKHRYMRAFKEAIKQPHTYDELNRNLRTVPLCYSVLAMWLSPLVTVSQLYDYLDIHGSKIATSFVYNGFARSILKRITKDKNQVIKIDYDNGREYRSSDLYDVFIGCSYEDIADMTAELIDTRKQRTYNAHRWQPIY